MAATIKNVAAVVTTGSLALVYTCNTNNGSIISAVQCANTQVTQQTVDVSLRKSGTDYYIIKGLIIPVGASVAVNADALSLAKNDAIYAVVSSGSASGVHMIISMTEYS